MEVRKNRESDVEQQRLQGFLLGLIVVLAALFVALEWNSSDSGWAFLDSDEELEAEMELSPLKREKDEVPMMLPQKEVREKPQSDQLRLVDETAELPVESLQPDEAVVKPEETADEKQPEVVDMYDEPVDFRVVEDLPQFPGGAAEFMKWLTKNLKYPSTAQRKGIKGKVVAQFIVNTDGTISDLELTQRLENSCDREVLRVLRMMPKWQAGLMEARPCRTRVSIPIVFNL